jgi:hypothetical protein
VDVSRFTDAELQAIARLKQTRPSLLTTVNSFVRFRDTQFVPYEVDSLSAADARAMRAFADKYPGAVAVLETFKGMRELFLKG